MLNWFSVSINCLCLEAIVNLSTFSVFFCCCNYKTSSPVVPTISPSEGWPDFNLSGILNQLKCPWYLLSVLSQSRKKKKNEVAA